MPLSAFSDTLPKEFYSLLGAKEEDRLKSAVSILETLQEFGEKGKRKAEAEKARAELAEMDARRAELQKLAKTESQIEDFEDEGAGAAAE